MANTNIDQGPINKFSILFYIVAFVLPLCIFLWWGNNLNERNKVLPFVVCIALFAAAGYLSAAKRLDKITWVLFSAIGGAALAAGLVFLV